MSAGHFRSDDAPIFATHRWLQFDLWEMLEAILWVALGLAIVKLTDRPVQTAVLEWIAASFCIGAAVGCVKRRRLEAGLVGMNLCLIALAAFMPVA